MRTEKLRGKGYACRSDEELEPIIHSSTCVIGLKKGNRSKYALPSNKTHLSARKAFPKIFIMDTNSRRHDEVFHDKGGVRWESTVD